MGYSRPVVLVRALASLALAAGLAVAGWPWRRRSWLGWLGLVAVGYLAWYVVVTRGLGTLPRWPEGARYNWVGKLSAIAWSLVLVAAIAPTGRALMGWRARVERAALVPALAVSVAVAALLFATFAAFIRSSPPDLEDHLFQSLVPGLDEELVFRGWLLAGLDQAFGTPWRLGGARVGWGLVVQACLFGLVHGLTVDHGALVFAPGFFLYTAAAGALLGWIRARTDSVWPAIVAHNLWNEAVTLARLV